jgi:hypothetical protein
MQIGILAPVPVAIFKSMLEFRGNGRLTLGTTETELFSRIGVKHSVDVATNADIAVLIYLTFRGFPDPLCDPGFVNYRGIFLRTVQPRGGKHPNLRREFDLTDDEPATGWPVFWEVGYLIHLQKHERVAINSLTAVGGTKPLPFGFVPRGPILVSGDTPFLATE